MTFSSYTSFFNYPHHRRVGSCESFLQVIGELIHECECLQVVAALDGTHRAGNADGKILRHETRLDGVDADLFERFSELLQIIVVVQRSTMKQAACPCEDRSDRIG